MRGVGRHLWSALAVAYVALGLFTLILYRDLATSAVAVVGALAMLGLAFAVAWASSELAARRARRRG